MKFTKALFVFVGYLILYLLFWLYFYLSSNIKNYYVRLNNLGKKPQISYIIFDIKIKPINATELDINDKYRILYDAVLEELKNNHNNHNNRNNYNDYNVINIDGVTVDESEV